MLGWLGYQKAPKPPDPGILRNEEVTDDPLAAFDMNQHSGSRPIYSVCRVNPLFQDSTDSTNQPQIPSRKARQRSPQGGEKSSSSGYEGSQLGSNIDLYPDNIKLRDDAVAILEQNPNYVKSIRVASRSGVGKQSSNSSIGTLTTIPEGRIDLPIPKPVWPQDDDKRLFYDSIVDDALLLYTSLSGHCIEDEKNENSKLDRSVKDVLVELLNDINSTMEGKTNTTPEDMLKIVNDKITDSIEALKFITEEEMKKLCVNLSNCKKINSVLKAFSNTSSSDSSGQSSPEWNGRVRTISSETEDFYQIPSGSSSSGFSDNIIRGERSNALPIFIHEDLGNVPNGVRNAMIYGTLCRAKNNSSAKLSINGVCNSKKKSLLAVEDSKPSVWEQYYGVKAVAEREVKYASVKPTDVPLFPGGRPEADFTLDVPRSEMLSKRMKEDKKWRCRCRLLTSFLGLIFFLLSVMAVSLMLTRGKRMFGSMM